MSLPPPEPEPTLPWMREAIDAFELDLDGLVVLTEAASGPFVLTPLIAALAGAEQVLGLTASSRHATGDEVVELTATYAARFDVDSRIEVITARTDPRLPDADVVTNLGFVRPLDRRLLERLGPHAAIALMCEPWELRPGDVDLEACRALGIPALGTNEDDERLKMFDYLPLIARFLLRELGVEVRGSRLVLVSTGRFASALAAGLDEMGADVASFTPAALTVGGGPRSPHQTHDGPAASASGTGDAGESPVASFGTGDARIASPTPVSGTGDAGNRGALHDGDDFASAPPPLTDTTFATAIGAADALVVADYPGSGPILGPRAAFTACDLRSLNPGIVLAHIAGDVVLDAAERASLPHAPARIAPAGTMSATAAELGARPVIDLHCAGLRVGAELSRARRHGHGARDAERHVLARLPLALGLPATEETTA